MSTPAAAEGLRRWREHPAAMVRELFHVEPDAWQEEALEAFPHTPRLAFKACKGPGKTTVLAWLAWNFLLTRPHPKVAATSNSKDNLKDNLWTEMSKWQQKSELLKDQFQWTKERITYKGAPETWWMSARAWSKDADPQSQADTLAGLHADYILFLIDESGGIPQAVMVAAEATQASGLESHIVQAGNPTALEGPLYRACTAERHLWKVIEITGDPDNPKRSSRVSVDWARQQIEKFGRDNPWVLVNVFGQFPPASINALLGPDDVSRAMALHYGEEVYSHAPRILGIDVAREGDDPSVLFPRQGIVALAPRTLRIPNVLQVAGHAAQMWGDFKPDGVFVDNTGGFGGGVIDELRRLGRDPVPVHFAGAPLDRRYANKRAEMLMECARWVKEGGALPNVPELAREMCAVTYTFSGDKLIVEPKEQIKMRLGHSTDYFDALALTFAYPVTRPSALQAARGESVPGRALTDYEPYADPSERVH